MNIIIFGETQRESHMFLHNLANTLDKKDISWLTRTKMVLENGDTYIAVDPNYVCGLRCDKAYVQRSLDERYLYSVIRPCFVNDWNIEYFDL